MSRHTRSGFVPNGEYLARKELRFHGKTYAIGKKFPWRKLSCSVRKLRQLYEAGYLKLKEDFEKAPVVSSPPVEEKIAAEEKSENFFTFDPEIHEIHKPRKGDCSILEDGEEVMSVDRAFAKDLEKATEPVTFSYDEEEED